MVGAEHPPSGGDVPIDPCPFERDRFTLGRCMRRIFLLLFLTVAFVASATPTGAQQGVAAVEILSHVDGETNVATPLKVEGRVDPNRSWSDVWVEVGGRFLFKRQVDVDAHGFFELDFDPQLSAFWVEPSVRISVDAYPRNGGPTESATIWVELDMSRRNTDPPVFTTNIPEEPAAISFPFELEVTVEPQFNDAAFGLDIDIYDESDQRVYRSLSTIGGEYSSETQLRSPPFTQTILLDPLKALDEFAGPSLRFEITVKHPTTNEIATHVSKTVRTTEPSFAPGLVEILSPLTGTGPLEYPILIVGTATGGFRGLDTIDLSIVETDAVGDGPASPDTYAFEIVEVPIAKDGSWAFWFDPRWVQGWVWQPDHDFVIQASARNGYTRRYHALSVRVGGERVDAYCFGFGATVDLSKGQEPTPYSDVIVGTDRRDRIDALGGHDIICAGAGRDVVIGGDGDDVIDAGPGRDRVITSLGDDIVYGKGGSDRIRTGQGNDGVVGGSGDDKIKLGPGDDVGYGDSGNDVINGDGGEDWIFAGDGDDHVMGGRGPDHIAGGLGRDSGSAGSGSDECIGGSFGSCEVNHD